MRSLLILVTMCGYSYCQFSSTGQKNIVDAHNKLRSSIAKGTYIAKGLKKPAGSNILKIKWDKHVAASAQSYANTCPTGHSKSVDRFGYGENLFWSWAPNFPPKDLNVFGVHASGAWSGEFTKYGWKTNKMDGALFRSGVGHATQMAWANTGGIGCGVKSCGKDKKTVVVVCQYKGPGNYMGQDIYKSGKTCSSCPPKTKCEKSTGICV
ncbi:Protein CBG01836 [Caenorhabditis briggsae]|uniref:Protein CBG01836 n=2 Tax=Caenorhabditis briggsae TaxID=6238 RepID=A8WQP4_CAEBR|nr:Protein CBG01836 [Caenorhabditis briggsae]CAP22802.1 Protein CBG01836 [Caenorhabditis briggsae]